MDSMLGWGWKPKDKVCPLCNTGWVDYLMDFDSECLDCRKIQQLVNEEHQCNLEDEQRRREFAERRVREMEAEQSIERLATKSHAEYVRNKTKQITQKRVNQLLDAYRKRKNR